MKLNIKDNIEVKLVQQNMFHNTKAWHAGLAPLVQSLRNTTAVKKSLNYHMVMRYYLTRNKFIFPVKKL